jgi:hypothetical protein
VLDGRPGEATALWESLDGRGAVTLAWCLAREGFHAILAPVLRESPAHPGLRQVLDAQVRAAAERDIRVDRCLDAIARVSARWPVALAGGARPRREVYPRSWMRWMADVDLLVRSPDLPAVSDALCAAGLVRVPPDPAHPVSDRLSHEIRFTAPGGMPVEVHSGAIHEPVGFRVDVEGILHRSDRGPVVDAPVPCAEDLVLLAAIRLCRVGPGSPLKHALDFHRWVEAKKLDPGALVARSRAWGCAGALGRLVRRAVEAFGTRVPKELVRLDAAGAWREGAIRGLEDAWTGRPGNPGDEWIRAALAPLGMDRCLDRAAFVAWMAGTRAADGIARAVAGGLDCLPSWRSPET